VGLLDFLQRTFAVRRTHPSKSLKSPSVMTGISLFGLMATNSGSENTGPPKSACTSSWSIFLARSTHSTAQLETQMDD
jgi:hypothetical protein